MIGLGRGLLAPNGPLVVFGSLITIRFAELSMEVIREASDGLSTAAPNSSPNSLSSFQGPTLNYMVSGDRD